MRRSTRRSSSIPTGETRHVVVPKGPFLRLTGFLSIQVTFADSSISLPFSLEGNFTFEQITLKILTEPVRCLRPRQCASGAANVKVNVLASDSPMARAA